MHAQYEYKIHDIVVQMLNELAINYDFCKASIDYSLNFGLTMNSCIQWHGVYSKQARHKFQDTLFCPNKFKPTHCMPQKLYA